MVLQTGSSRSGLIWVAEPAPALAQMAEWAPPVQERSVRLGLLRYPPFAGSRRNCSPGYTQGNQE